MRAKHSKPKAKKPEEVAWELRLYIANNSATSMLAVANLQVFCERYLRSQYHLRIVDILEDPDAAIHDNIIATPALICIRPKRQRTLIGCFSDIELLVRTLDINPGLARSPSPWIAKGALIQEIGQA